MKRTAGILLPITSLPSQYGIGGFTQSAYDFIDWLKEAGQSYWQILPLGPTSYGDSPYQSFSTFAGNPYFINLEALVDEGVLHKEECEAADFGSEPGAVDYEKLYKARYTLLYKAYQRSWITENHDYQHFVRKNKWWLTDYALFMAIKEQYNNVSWDQWPEDIRLRKAHAMTEYYNELFPYVEFHQYMQFKFHEQWSALKAYANQKGIRLIGDIPIYVAMDSADTWAHPELFQLDEQNVPLAVAGCRTDSLPTVSSGAIRSTAGNITVIPIMNGGSPVWHTASRCMMYLGSIISGDSMNITLFHTERRRQPTDTGRRVPASNCSSAWSSIWAVMR